MSSNKKIAQQYAKKAYSVLKVGGIWSSILNNVPSNQKKMIIRQYGKIFGKDNVKWDRETHFVTCTRSA
jgi:hypothetical protein